MRSLRLRTLEKRYKELRSAFLPRRFSSTGSYTTAQYTSAAAFKLLFHSELESFFEDAAEELLSGIDFCVRSNADCRGSASILSLYKADAMGGIPNQFSEIDTRPFFRRAQLACVHALRQRIASNKGIKPQNILPMFIPLGINETEIEEQLLIDLNTFGARRGDAAHKSLPNINVIPDPKDDKEISERIIFNLKKFEMLFPSCLLSN